ncbi:MAG: AAA family ATPase [Chlamydiota bacterium]
MKKLPIGIQSIEKILDGGKYVYIDKTGFAKELIDEGASHYFMSRPRRFGKSLFLNTLEEIFKGNRELFNGCRIDAGDYRWEKYPVLHFDFAKILSQTPEDFKRGLEDTLEDLSKSYGISIEGSSYLSKCNRLITDLSKKNRVVVLVDEYDSPIIDHLKNPAVAEQNRDLLKAFFGTLKSLDRYLRFTFAVGVSKFSQVSLFSGPNNLKDITMDPRYAAMMGYTEKELKESFKEYLQLIVDERSESETESGLTEKDILDEVRSWYNGYRFSKREISVYNPCSTLNFMDQREAQSYWYSTGTPSFLIDQLKDQTGSIESLTGAVAVKSELSDIGNLERIDPVALMFQTGYFTILSHDPSTDLYRLGFPNREVSQAFSKSLLQSLASIQPGEILSQKIEDDLERRDYATFFGKIKAHFAKIPYHLSANRTEKFYHALFSMLLHTAEIGIVRSEDPTNTGRIDLVIETANTIVIFELKTDKTATEALQQAEDMDYKRKYTHQEKKIAVIGVNFNSESRNIDAWQGSLHAPDGKPIREIAS